MNFTNAAFPTGNFSLQIPALSLIERLLWPFSSTGQLHRLLYHASLSPGDTKAINALTVFLQTLMQRQPSCIKDNDLVAKSLLLLTWIALETDNLDKAHDWLLKLQVQKTQIYAATRIYLRWQLMEKWFTTNYGSPANKQFYINEAEIFLSDPALTWKDYAPIILLLIRKLYEELSPTACKQVLDQRNEHLQSVGQLKSVVGLCEEIIQFDTFVTIEHFRKLNKNGIVDLTFSPPMYADALLNMTRTAEWLKQWPAMYFYADQASQLLPNSTNIQYWLLRASLYFHNACLVFPTPSDKPTPRWLRLQLLNQIDTNLNLDTIEALLDATDVTIEPADTPEKLLIAERIRKNFAHSAAVTPAEMTRIAKISELIGLRLGLFSWTEVYIAWKLAYLDHDYAAARQKMEAKDIAAESMDDGPGTRLFARLVRIMLGIPVQYSSKNSELASEDSELEGLSQLEDSLLRLAVVANHHTAVANHSLDWTPLIEAKSKAIFTQFPQLELIADALILALRAITADPTTVRADFLNYKIPPFAPPWIGWLISRIAITLCDQEIPLPFIEKIDQSQPACCWELEWWNSKVANILQLQVQTTASSDTKTQHFRSHRTPDKFPELGKICSQVCTAEEALELSYMRGRTELATGNASKALESFKAMQTSLLTQPPIYPYLTTAIWLPLLQYWCGIAAAHLGTEDAADILKRLISGFKGIESRAQLAILAVQNNDLDTADRWLQGITVLLPSVLYARMLVAERLHDSTALEHLAASFTASTTSTPQPYTAAIKRLLAALDERQGKIATAIVQHKAILATNPEDDIASSRLRRLLVRQYYQLLPATSDTNPTAPTAEMPTRISNTITWDKTYASLYEWLTCTQERLDLLQAKQGRDHSIPKAKRLAWRQLYVKNLLQANRIEQALLAIEPSTDAIEDTTEPVWLRNTRLVLKVWKLLSQIKHSLVPDSHQIVAMKRYLAQIEMLTTTSNDELFLQWQALLRLAITWIDNPQYVFSIETTLEPWPMAWIPGLWSPNQEVRTKAATLLSSKLDQNTGWSDQQRNVLRAICAWNQAHDDQFLAAYAKLHQSLDELPLIGAPVWIAAAKLWFQREQWNDIIEGTMPDCVADLTDSAVRLIVGLAYARTAIVEAERNNNTRKAIQRIKQARITLKELI